MPIQLEQQHYTWLHNFTNGEILLPEAMQLPEDDDLYARLKVKLEKARSKEWLADQALKKALVQKASDAVNAKKDEIRQACDVEGNRFKEGKPGEIEAVSLRGRDGQQEKAIDTGNTGNLSGVPTKSGNKSEMLNQQSQGNGIDAKQWTLKETDLRLVENAMKLVHDEKDKLLGFSTTRSYIDLEKKDVRTRPEPLFTDDEIATELYNPLVQELVIPETLVPPQYSKTQKMIDGSNAYYLNDCKAKGSPLSTSRAAISKAVLTTASAAASAVFDAIGPSPAGKLPIPHMSLDPEKAAKWNDLATGAAYALIGAGDAIAVRDDFRQSGDFSASGYQNALNELAVAAGRIVAGVFTSSDLGLVVTDSITGASSISSLIPDLVKRYRGKEPVAVDRLIESFGGLLAAGFSAASDQTTGQMSNGFAYASNFFSASFKATAGAKKNDLVAAWRRGDDKAVCKILVDSGSKVLAIIPNVSKLSRNYDAMRNSPDDLFDQDKAAGDAGIAVGDIEAIGSAFAEKVVHWKDNRAPRTPETRDAAAIDKLFEDLKKEKGEEVAETDRKKLKKIAEQLDKEQEEYEQSLTCLNAEQPTEAELKSIKRLIEQQERDRKTIQLVITLGAAPGAGGAVWGAINPLSEFLCVLRSANQLMAFIGNVKALWERQKALNAWKDSHANAVNAISPYATAIENFVSNQSKQRTHLFAQAFANVIQVGLAMGGLSPHAPIFRVAEAVVATAAGLEDTLYKYKKEVALRTAWAKTKEAFDPRNRGNRALALQVRKLNPTLAKYTLAYGALIEKSPIAITAMNRINMDRESLANFNEGVTELVKYLEELYPDDGAARGVLDPTTGAALPEPALTIKTWSMTYLLWSEKFGLATENPKDVSSLLPLIEKLQLEMQTKPEKADRLVQLLQKLRCALISFKPMTKDQKSIAIIDKLVLSYIDLVDDTLLSLAIARSEERPEEEEMMLEPLFAGNQF